jgi:hypothetical protein
MADLLLPDLNQFVAPFIYDDLREEIKVGTSKGWAAFITGTLRYNGTCIKSY